MGRVKSVVVAGMLAVAVCVVAAGPAAAAKGGNSDNAHACQQGAHENRFEAETGNPFKNAGDCTSHGAQGGATASLQFLTSPIYPCPASTNGCFGVISGSGLRPQAGWDVVDIDTTGVVAHGEADVNGNLTPTEVDLGCGIVVGQLRVQSLVPGGRIFFEVNSPSCG